MLKVKEKTIEEQVQEFNSKYPLESKITVKTPGGGILDTFVGWLAKSGLDGICFKTIKNQRFNINDVIGG